MILYPRTNTYDQFADPRYGGGTTPHVADPYSVYKVNESSVSAVWSHIAAAYGMAADVWDTRYWTEDQRASQILNQLSLGRYPIVHVSAGHYFVISGYSPMPGSPALSSIKVVPEPEWIPGPDVALDDVNAEALPGAPEVNGVTPQGITPGGYDDDFLIYDPYITQGGLGGPHIRFYMNIKQASFSSIDQMIFVRLPQ